MSLKKTAIGATVVFVPATAVYTDEKLKKVQNPFENDSKITVMTFPTAVKDIYKVYGNDEHGGEVAKLALQVENKAYEIPNVTNDTKAGTIVEILSKQHTVKISEDEEVTLWEHACKHGYCQLNKHIWECNRTLSIWGTDTMGGASNEMIDFYAGTDKNGVSVDDDKGCLWDGADDSVGYFSRRDSHPGEAWFHIVYRNPANPKDTWVAGIELPDEE
jgi:hypothetical protein